MDDLENIDQQMKVFSLKAQNKFQFDADLYQRMGVPVFEPSFAATKTVT